MRAGVDVERQRVAFLAPRRARLVGRTVGQLDGDEVIVPLFMTNSLVSAAGFRPALLARPLAEGASLDKAKRREHCPQQDLGSGGESFRRRGSRRTSGTVPATVSGPRLQARGRIAKSDTGPGPSFASPGRVQPWAEGRAMSPLPFVTTVMKGILNARYARGRARVRSDRRHRLARARNRRDDRRQRVGRRRCGDHPPRQPVCRRLPPPPPVCLGLDQWSGGVADRRPHSRGRGQSHLAVHRRHPRQRSRRGQCAPVRVTQRRYCLADRGRARAAVGAVGVGGDRRCRGGSGRSGGEDERFADGRGGVVCNLARVGRRHLCRKPRHRRLSGGRAEVAWHRRVRRDGRSRWLR